MWTSSTSARSFLPLRSRPPWRSRRRSMTSKPTLWRVPAYSAPGLPSPTTRRSAMDQRVGPELLGAVVAVGALGRLAAGRLGTLVGLGRGLGGAGGAGDGDLLLG